jgi:hypothetical protein
VFPALQGYELRLGNGENDKGDWEAFKNVKGTEAYLQWKKNKPAYFYQVRLLLLPAEPVVPPVYVKWAGYAQTRP